MALPGLSGLSNSFNCFNPSFTGIALVAYCEPRLFDFLSTSFNPSFTGIALVAVDKNGLSMESIEFQSFFYWNCLGG